MQAQADIAGRQHSQSWCVCQVLLALRVCDRCCYLCVPAGGGWHSPVVECSTWLVISNNKIG
jgi:hypothetical protein